MTATDFIMFRRDDFIAYMNEEQAPMDVTGRILNAALPVPMTFADLRGPNVVRCARWHSDGVAWNIAEWTNALQGEAGEAGNVAKKIRRVETNAHGRPSEQDVAALEAKLADELADTVIYADLTAAERNIDLAAAIQSKFNRTSEEYGFPERL